MDAPNFCSTFAVAKDNFDRGINCAIVHNEVTHVADTKLLDFHISALLLQTLEKVGEDGWGPEKIVGCAHKLTVYITRQIFRDTRASKKPLVLDNLELTFRKIPDPEETMQKPRGKAWYNLRLRENLPDSILECETLIDGKAARDLDDAFVGFFDLVDEQLHEWEEGDSMLPGAKRKRGREASKINPLEALQEIGPLAAHLEMCFLDFDPPTPWNEVEIVAGSEAFATYLDLASRRIWKGIKRPVVLENLQFLYHKTSARPIEIVDGKEVQHYELLFVEALPEQGPGKNNTLIFSKLCATKEGAFDAFVAKVKGSLQEWADEGKKARKNKMALGKEGAGSSSKRQRKGKKSALVVGTDDEDEDEDDRGSEPPKERSAKGKGKGKPVEEETSDKKRGKMPKRAEDDDG